MRFEEKGWSKLANGTINEVWISEDQTLVCKIMKSLNPEDLPIHQAADDPERLARLFNEHTLPHLPDNSPRAYATNITINGKSQKVLIAPCVKHHDGQITSDEVIQFILNTFKGNPTLKISPQRILVDAIATNSKKTLYANLKRLENGTLVCIDHGAFLGIGRKPSVESLNFWTGNNKKSDYDCWYSRFRKGKYKAVTEFLMAVLFIQEHRPYYCDLEILQTDKELLKLCVNGYEKKETLQKSDWDKINNAFPDLSKEKESASLQEMAYTKSYDDFISAYENRKFSITTQDMRINIEFQPLENKWVHTAFRILFENGLCKIKGNEQKTSCQTVFSSTETPYAKASQVNSNPNINSSIRYVCFLVNDVYVKTQATIQKYCKDADDAKTILAAKYIELEKIAASNANPTDLTLKLDALLWKFESQQALYAARVAAHDNAGHEGGLFFGRGFSAGAKEKEAGIIISEITSCNGDIRNFDTLKLGDASKKGDLGKLRKELLELKIAAEEPAPCASLTH